MMGGFLKILLAALSVAPELIQTGKTVVKTVKGVAGAGKSMPAPAPSQTTYPNDTLGA